MWTRHVKSRKHASNACKNKWIISKGGQQLSDFYCNFQVHNLNRRAHLNYKFIRSITHFFRNFRVHKLVTTVSSNWCASKISSEKTLMRIQNQRWISQGISIFSSPRLLLTFYPKKFTFLGDFYALKHIFFKFGMYLMCVSSMGQKFEKMTIFERFEKKLSEKWKKYAKIRTVFLTNFV